MSRITRVVLILFACSVASWSFNATLAQVGQPGPWNPGNPPSIQTGPVPDSPIGGPTLACVGNTLVEPPAGTLAVITVPASIDNGDVIIEVWNASNEKISYVSLDGYDAQGAQGLHFDAATVLRHPMNGLAEVRYPVAGTDGIGPAVLAFENGGLLKNDCATLEVRVGSWDQHSFHAQVVDMLDTQVRVVFGDGLRGNGRLQLCPQSARIQAPSVGKIVCRPGDAVAVIAEHRAQAQ